MLSPGTLSTPSSGSSMFKVFSTWGRLRAAAFATSEAPYRVSLCVVSNPWLRLFSKVVLPAISQASSFCRLAGKLYLFRTTLLTLSVNLEHFTTFPIPPPSSAKCCELRAR